MATLCESEDMSAVVEVTVAEDKALVETSESVETKRGSSDKYADYKVWHAPRAGWMSRAWKKHISWDLKEIDSTEYRRARDGKHYKFESFKEFYGDRAIMFWNEERRTDWWGKTWTKQEFFKKWGDKAEKFWEDCAIFTEKLHSVPAYESGKNKTAEKMKAEEPEAENNPEAKSEDDSAWELATVSSDEFEDQASVLLLDDVDETPKKIDHYEDYQTLETAEILPCLSSAVTQLCIVGDVAMPTLDEIAVCNEDMCKLYPGGHIFVCKIRAHGGICELVLKNNSDEIEWPVDTKLRLVCGSGAGVCGEKTASVGACGPHESIGIQFNFAPGDFDRDYSYWVLESQGKAFGQCLIFERI